MMKRFHVSLKCHFNGSVLYIRFNFYLLIFQSWNIDFWRSVFIDPVVRQEGDIIQTFIL